MILIESLVAGGCAIRHRVLHTPTTSGLVLRKQLWGHGVLGSAWAVLGPSQKIPTPYILEYPEQVGAWEGRAMQPGFGKMPSAAYKTD